MAKGLAEKGAWFQRIADNARRKNEWRSALELPNQAITREARSADLVVIGQEREEAWTARSMWAAQF
jgi:hypothetical protein